MLWFLVLHIAALVFWCAALLYLPFLIAGVRSGRLELAGDALAGDALAGDELGGDELGAPQEAPDSLERFMFTHIATPPAVIAILAGTGVFMLERIVDPWLILKLTLVSAFVLAHSAVGILILWLEGNAERSAQPWCALLVVVVAVLITAIITVVLAKPAFELDLQMLPWPL